MARKTAKATIKKAHRIARAIMRRHSRTGNAWAIGMSQAKKAAGRRKRRRR